MSFLPCVARFPDFDFSRYDDLSSVDVDLLVAPHRRIVGVDGRAVLEVYDCCASGCAGFHLFEPGAPWVYYPDGKALVGAVYTFLDDLLLSGL